MLSVILLCCVLGGITARMDGGGWPHTNEWIERTLCIAPFVAVCVPLVGWCAALAYIGVIGLATGHGQYFLNRSPRYCSPEKVDRLVSLIFGADPRTSKEFEGYTSGSYDEYFTSLMSKRILLYGKTKLYWRCVFGMFVTGTLVGLPAACIALWCGDLCAASILSSTGIVKAIAYMFGHYLFNNTESAEFTNGFLRNLLALISLGVYL